ncbi:MAG: ATP-binding cassette domain-containing protein [bacterium]
MSEQLVIDLCNVYLTSDRGDPIFSNLNLQVPAGHSAVIVGPAGSGKSCLLQMLVGRRWPDSGSVELLGNCLQRHRNGLVNRIRRRVGGIGGIFGLVPTLTVAENVAFPLILNGERKRSRREKLMKTLADFSLLRVASEYPAALTRVENTLAQFARASISAQPIVLIDEPLAGLDTQTYDRIFDYLVKISLSGRSMIMVAGDPPKKQLPQAKHYEIRNGTLQ